MKLFNHQQQFLTDNPDKALLAWEGGTGKTLAGTLWLKQGRDTHALVICPKRVVQKWRDELKRNNVNAEVISKETFKKTNAPQEKWSALVVDEADEFAAPLFTKQRSQLATALYTNIKKYNPHILLLTATPIRSTPANLHTLLCYMGHYIEWKKWRDKFFTLERRPFLFHATYFPKNGWQKEMRKYLEQYASVVLMKDCVEYLPPVTEEVIKLAPKPFVGQEYEPAAAFVEEHRFEQKDKLKTILEASKGYRKVIVVAHYVEQVESLARELQRTRETFMVHGGIKDQEKLLREANECDECFLVIQASLGAGFDADSFSCLIFASMSYRVRDFVQMKYRIRRIHNLHPVKYIYVIGGVCDKAVYATVMRGRDFVPSEWKIYDSTRTS